jgi:hypothetical protein
MVLSGKRVNVVAALLDGNSASELGGHLQVKVDGERRNKVLTIDGKSEMKNCRVKTEIIRQQLSLMRG